MPAKSKSQFKKMFVLYKQGKITKAELDKFTHGVNYRSLPKKKATGKRKARPKKGRR